jgi:hypothetical protein
MGNLKQIMSGTQVMAQIAQILSAALPATAPILAPSSGVLTILALGIEKHNEARFERLLENRFGDLETNFIRWDSLESEEYRDLLLRFWEVCRKTASDRKLAALATAFVNSIQLDVREFDDKPLLLRVFDQVSQTEWQVLQELNRFERTFQDRAAPERKERTELFFQEHLGWSDSNVHIAFTGLAQLQLVSDGFNIPPDKVFERSLDGGTFDPTPYEKSNGWWTTAIARRLIEWTSERVANV